MGKRRWSISPRIRSRLGLKPSQFIRFEQISPILVKRSQAQFLSRAKGQGYGKSQWFRHSMKLYNTVQLGYQRRPGKGSWWLAYNNRLATGAFPTRNDAVGWFTRGGR